MPCVKSHVNVKFLNSIENLTACRVSNKSQVNVKFLKYLTVCDVSLTKEISCKCHNLFLNSTGNLIA